MLEYLPVNAIIGGLLLGLSSFLLLWLAGRIAGISGIIEQSFNITCKNSHWRIAFIVGLVVSPFILHFLFEDINVFPANFSLTPQKAIVGGFLVGLGTRIGSGCTSGHGICGIGRGSIRSLVATITFMTVAIITVFIGKSL